MRARLSSRARILTPSKAGYDRARQLLNRQYNFRPAVIVKCATATDVASAIRMARRRELVLSVRSGGCSPGGFSSNNGGVMIDLSPMKQIAIDPTGRSVRVGGGVLLKDLVTHLSPTGLMVPVGECMPVGLPGLALGGGFGLLSRSLGLTCDNILEAQVVTAEGEVLTASEAEHPDLFWALRGAGGGNFGVVTRLTMRLHRIPPAVAFVQAFWPLDQAADVLKATIADFAATAPDELDALISMLPLPGGQRALGMLGVYHGAPSTGTKVLAGLTGRGKPSLLKTTTGPYAKLLLSLPNQAADIHDYYKSGFVTGRLPDQAIDLLVDRFARTEEYGKSIENMIMFELAGGAINVIPPAATAFVHRTHTLLLSLVATWNGNPEDRDRPEERWADDLYRDLATYYSGEVYQNYPDRGLANPLRAYYGRNLPRLKAIKRQYDPENVFRFAQGIPPA